jgi:hypothetical protein
MPPPPPQYVPLVPLGKSLAFGAFLLIAGWTCFGEWICLRSLEIGHLAHGGTGAVWTAIGILTTSVLGNLALRILMPT